MCENKTENRWGLPVKAQIAPESRHGDRQAACQI